MLNQGSGPQPLPLPEGFGTPDSKHSRFFPHSDVPELRRTLLDVDAAFSQASVENGTGPAFERYAAPNGLAVSGTFLFGPEAIGQAFASEPGDTVSWVPRFAGAAPSGDPRLILQPLVENAIRHGITRRLAPGRVDVRAWTGEGRLHLAVSDDGVGLRSPLRDGVGLGITRARLRQLYGAEQQVDLSPAPGGGAVCALSIPLRLADPAEAAG